MGTRRKIGMVIGAAAVLGGAAVATKYRHEIKAIRAKVLAVGRIAETSAGRIEYGIWGSGSPLLAIHGAGGGYDQGLLIGGSLVADGFEIIAPSRFGYLRTPVPKDGSPAAEAGACVALLDSLGVERVVVAGASAGAPAAMQVALRRPERVAALILLAPRGYAPGHIVQLDATPGNRVVTKIVFAGADFAYWSMLHLMPAVLAQFVGVPAELLKNASREDRAWVNRMLASIQPLSMRIAGLRNDSATRLDAWPLERITAPTLIVTSSDDLFHTQPAAEYTAAHIPRAKLIVYPTGGHLFIGHSEELRHSVASFLREALP
jgi:pimeloyl-ACP methyl ester carboxylesterase